MKPEPSIHGLPLSEVARRVGSIDQLARIDHFTEAEGPRRGTRRIRLVTGGGLEVELHPDRAFDIGQVTFRGVPVAWVSPMGQANPAFYDASGMEWLRTFGGGLMCTCGLDTFGPASVDRGVSYPMHGRVGAIPGTLLRAEAVDGRLIVECEVRQAKVFEENLVLHRRIEAPIGGCSLRITDTVTNHGPSDAGHMLLYHCNVGWPLLDEAARLSIPSVKVTPRDDAATAGVARWHLIDPPERGYREQVFIHELGEAKRATVSVDNPNLGIRLELSFDTTTLPGFHQWKMADEGHFVMGLEPNNCNWTGGRASAQASGVLPVLKPGETVRYDLQFDLGPSCHAPNRTDLEQ